MMDVHFGDTLWLLRGAVAYGALCRSGRMVRGAAAIVLGRDYGSLDQGERWLERGDGFRISFVDSHPDIQSISLQPTRMWVRKCGCSRWHLQVS